MSYTIDIPASVYMNWPFVDEFLTANTMYAIFEPTASTWFNNRHPEIIEVSDLMHTIDYYFFRTFTFESEAHYTWFVLQQ